MLITDFSCNAFVRPYFFPFRKKRATLRPFDPSLPPLFVIEDLQKVVASRGIAVNDGGVDTFTKGE